MDTLTSEGNGDAPAITSAAVALQQAELKKDILYSMINSKSQSELKCACFCVSVEGDDLRVSVQAPGGNLGWQECSTSSKIPCFISCPEP